MLIYVKYPNLALNDHLHAKNDKWIYKDNCIYIFLISKQAYLLILEKNLVIRQLMSLTDAISWTNFVKLPKNIITKLLR